MDPEEKDLLRQILKWTREGALSSVLDRIRPYLDSEAKKRVYHAIAEGSRSPRTIEEVAGVGRVTAEKFVEEWRGAGLVVPDSDPPKAVFTLFELGIPAPELKAGRSKATKTN